MLWASVIRQSYAPCMHILRTNLWKKPRILRFSFFLSLLWAPLLLSFTVTLQHQSLLATSSVLFVQTWIHRNSYCNLNSSKFILEFRSALFLQFFTACRCHYTLLLRFKWEWQEYKRNVTSLWKHRVSISQLKYSAIFPCKTVLDFIYIYLFTYVVNVFKLVGFCWNS